MASLHAHSVGRGVIQIYDTYISLPSGSQLALNCTQSFTPNREFWQLWTDDKLAVKHAGVSVKRERFGWRGYVRDDARGFWKMLFIPSSVNNIVTFRLAFANETFQNPKGFSDGFHTDLHQLWTDKARDLAEGDTVLPVMIAHAVIHNHVKTPCPHTGAFQVVAKVCRNRTFQLRLRCDTCDRQTQGAIKWEYFSSDVLIPAIAHAIQVDRVREKNLNSPLFEELKGVSWV